MSEQLKPELRFPEFDGDWTTKSLGNPEVATFFKGKGISKNDIVEDGETPCIRYGELYTEYNEVIDEVKSSTDVPVDELVLSEEFDVIIPASGETVIDIATASCVLKSDIALGGDLNIIRPNTLNGVFLAYYLNNAKKRNIARLAQGISVIHLYKNHLKSLSLNIPEPEEQQKIANFLKAIDKRIKLLKAKKEALEEYKTSIMQKLFAQEIRFKQDDGTDFPEWEEKRIGDLFNNTGGTSLEEFQSEYESHKFISIGNYSKNGKYIDNGQRVVLNDKTKTKLLDKNNLVMVLNDKTKTGDIIGSTILIDSDNEYIYNQRSERLICLDAITPYFSWYLINSRKIRRKIFSVSQGGTQIYVNFPEVKKIRVRIPIVEEQIRMSNFLVKLDEKVNALENKLEESSNLKYSLLQKMFV
ncbi:restriction endonuclease subunit S [Polaribacter sp. OB-PA-B3]